MRSEAVARPASHFVTAGLEVVPAEFAKQLEKELEKALQVIREHEDTIKGLKQQCDAATIMLSDFDPQNLL
jgi:hypothetical protein